MSVIVLNRKKIILKFLFTAEYCLLRTTGISKKCCKEYKKIILKKLQNLIGKYIEVICEASDTSLKTTKRKIIEEEGWGILIAKIDSPNRFIPIGAFVRVSYL